MFRLDASLGTHAPSSPSPCFGDSVIRELYLLLRDAFSIFAVILTENTDSDICMPVMKAEAILRADFWFVTELLHRQEALGLSNS
jgi:hypothetical protein